jgi:hypothetical protein
MTPNPILERIRKLRALSRSASAHEAAAAAAIAEKLIAEHGIAEAMLDAGDGEEDIGDHDPLDVMAAGRFVHWKSYLLSNLCDLHGCAHCYAVEGGRRVAVFFGRRSDVDIVKDLYGWLSSEVERLSSKAARGKSKEWTSSYRLGCVRGIGDAMLAAQKRARKDAPSMALAVLDGRLELSQHKRDEATGEAPKVKAQADDVIDDQEEAFERGRVDGWSAERAGRQSHEKEGTPRLTR